MINLFVYGTLKHGYWNNHILTSAFGVLKGDYLAYNYTLVQQGVPAALPEYGSTISGEVWTFPDNTVLKKTDWLESEGEYYIRKEIEVYLRVESSVQPVRAYIYLGSPKHWNVSVSRCRMDDDGIYYWSD